MKRKILGSVTGGTFLDGLDVRLEPDINTEDVPVGSFCVLEGDRYRYFGTVQNVRLHATDNRLMVVPPRHLSPFTQRIIRGTAGYAVAEIKPALMIERLPENAIVDEVQPPRPVKTIPMHFAHMVEARPEDFVLVFGEERDDPQSTFFALGKPLTMEIDVCVDLRRLVERSTGIFGSTGTGKSFLTRLLLSGIIWKDVAVSLVFDMHGEYATSQQSESGDWVKGLRDLFGSSRVAVYSLDENKTSNVDGNIVIGLNHIESGDILLLQDELGLPKGTTETNIAQLERAFGEGWVSAFLALDPEEVKTFADEIGGHAGSLQALHRKLTRLRNKSYVLDNADYNAIDQILRLIENGRHVIVQFGQYNSLLDYLLVANIITRRIRNRYEEQVEKFLLTKQEADKPKPLVIVVEEAHKFLGPEMAHQTIFGTIAREMRKYFVTLLIVDQRPSGIDDEILSQLGTRISGRLNDQRDLDAVLTGVADRATVRSMLTTLDTRQQVVVFGHAMPMPVQLRTRRYDETFYQQVRGGKKGPSLDAQDLDQLIDDLYG
ncbi:MAG: ATP-binding protein [Ardenticatenia bacterium]|nr:MAG: ATP-binding protein [Ardenticatenia bacterium]